VSIRDDVIKIARDAKEASKVLANLTSRVKDRALLAMADGLKQKIGVILAANEKDLRELKRRGLSSAFCDRLQLSRNRILDIARSVEDVAKLSDPIGEVLRMWRRPNGMIIGKVRVPIGVIGIIYESRPNVTCDCSSLCIKSGNSVILRGGKEAINSNIAIWEVLMAAAKKEGLPQGSINLIQTTDRKAVEILLKLDTYIDLIVPRGGEELIKKVVRISRIPVVKHYKGVCHTYVDEYADLNMAADIVFNAKVQRPGVCNAMETLLVHRDIAGQFLPSMVKKLKAAGCEIRGCPETRRIVKDIAPAKHMDWTTEYLDLILSVKVCGTIDEALDHIGRFGTKHSEAIVTSNYPNALRFLSQVDAACVYVNASTRLTDGGQFGMGAEIGISTEKVHARGPMGLEELTSYKYIIFGSGQIRE